MKTGLFFGSFNPIHIGHLALANYMVEFTDLEELWFVVSPHNPLKDRNTLLDGDQRLRMVQLAIENDLRLKVSDIEFTLPQPSYTIHTLDSLAKKFPEREFVIIMGSDGLATFKHWKDYKRLVENYKRYIYPRPDTAPRLLKEVENASIVNAPLMDISSTSIRQAIAGGRDVRHFVPDKVWQYITSNKCYLP
jgi:nicotinate-nucleotide adenylyltransferase